MTQNRRLFWISISMFVLMLFLTASPTMSGEVVTKETRSWAKEVLAQEKTGALQISKNSLGVLYFHNKTGKPEFDKLQKGLAVMLTTDLAQVKRIQLVERIKMQALVEELNIGKSGLVDAQTAPRVGRLMQAEYLLGGNMLPDKLTDLQVEPGILDVPKEKTYSQPPVKGKADELINIEKEILFGTVAKLEHIKLTKEEEEKLRKPLSTKVKALFYLFDAVDQSDNEKYEQATNSYLSAYQEDPELSLAKEAILEIISKGLISAAVIITIKQAIDKIESQKRGKSGGSTSPVLPNLPKKKLF